MGRTDAPRLIVPILQKRELFRVKYKIPALLP